MNAGAFESFEALRPGRLARPTLSSATMRFVFVMDPMDRLLPDKDTTFAFQRSAQRRGHVALHCEPRDVYVDGGDVWARARGR